MKLNSNLTNQDLILGFEKRYKQYSYLCILSGS